MLKKFNKYLNLAVSYNLFLLGFGIFLIVNPEVSSYTIIYIIGGSLIVNGVSMAASEEKNFIVDMLSLGIISILLGFIMIFYPKYILEIIPIIAGLWMTICSLFKLRLAIILKEAKVSNWSTSLVLSILTIIAGLILIFNPEIGSLAFTLTLGILCLVYGVSSIINIYIFKRNINDLSKKINKL